MIHAFHELKRRLSARDDSEHEQAALRIVIVGLVLGYMASFHGSPAKWSPQDWTIILGLTGFFTVAIALFVSICLWPAKNVPRRLIGMLDDRRAPVCDVRKRLSLRTSLPFRQPGTGATRVRGRPAVRKLLAGASSGR